MNPTGATARTNTVSANVPVRRGLEEFIARNSEKYRFPPLTIDLKNSLMGLEAYSSDFFYALN
jgi:hypothetical protein